MKRPVLYFGERCLYRPCGAVTRQAKLEARWQPGAYLGMLEYNLIYLVVTEEGVVSRCADVKRLAEGEQFPSPLVSNLRATPWEPRPGEEGSEVTDAVPTWSVPDPEAQLRRLYITKRM
eukprot:5712-Amphidinium_carterae.1